MQDVALFLILVGVGILIYLVKHSLPAYFARKAENLAQKEDLKILTEIPERVRAQFGQANIIHRVQFEAEFRHYQNVWHASHSAFKCFIRLYPVAELTVGQSEFDAFIKSQLEYADALDNCKPFIPDEVWSTFHEFDECLIDAKMQGLRGRQRPDVREYREEVRQAFDQSAEAIAARLRNLLVVEV